MKQPIAWYERCLSILTKCLAIKVEELERCQRESHQLLDEVAILERQVREAKRLEMTEFDADEFLVKGGNL